MKFENIRIFYRIISLCLILSAACHLESKAADHKAVKISEVEDFVMRKVSEGTEASSILVIFDVDGTLTSRPEPRGTRVTARGRAVEIVKAFHEKGIHLIASSAWNKFQETVTRIRNLGLHTEFKIPEQDGEIQTDTKIQIDTTQTLAAQSFRMGNVISVQDPDMSWSYFRQKALTPFLSPEIHTALELDQIKMILFSDDSIENIEIFKNDVAKYHLFPGITLEYFTLGHPDDELERLPPALPFVLLPPPTVLSPRAFL